MNTQASPQVVFFGTEFAATDVARFVIPVELLGGFFFVVIALAMVGPGQALGRALNSVPWPPSRNGLLVGTSLLDGGAHMLAGDSTPDAPLVGSLVAFALLSALGRPLARDIRAASRSARAELARIPQYIVRLNRPDEFQSSN